MRPMARSPRKGVFSTFVKHSWRPATLMWNFGSSELTISPKREASLVGPDVAHQVAIDRGHGPASTARLRTRWSLSAVFVGFDWVWAKAQALHP